MVVWAESGRWWRTTRGSTYNKTFNLVSRSFFSDYTGKIPFHNWRKHRTDWKCAFQPNSSKLTSVKIKFVCHSFRIFIKLAERYPPNIQHQLCPSLVEHPDETPYCQIHHACQNGCSKCKKHITVTIPSSLHSHQHVLSLQRWPMEKQRSLRVCISSLDHARAYGRSDWKWGYSTRLEWMSTESDLKSKDRKMK